VCVACKFVQNAVRKAGLAGMLGLAGETNVQGEDQKKLDVLANEAFINVLSRCGQCGLLVSEEDEDPIVVPAATAGGYAVVFDPLDGSSNIDCGVSIGTIYGIFKLPERGPGDPPPSGADVLRAGSTLVAAGYCLYGSSCAMVLSLNGAPPSVFTLDPSLGEFVLTADRVTVKPAGSIYSVNEGNAAAWDAGTAAYVEACKRPPAGGGKAKSAR
jgi:fructose-1,6-bisphosphatase I